MDSLLSHLQYLESKCADLVSDPFTAIVVYPTLAFAFDLLRRSNSSFKFLNLSNLIESLSVSPLIKNSSNFNTNKAVAVVSNPNPSSSQQQNAAALNIDWSEVGLVSFNHEYVYFLNFHKLSWFHTVDIT